MFVLCFLILAGKATLAQEPHWGIQGDGGYGWVPSIIVDGIHNLPEQPSITGTSFSVGLARFHADGSPNFAVQYHQVNADLNGSLTMSGFTAGVTGTGSIRGVLADKYLNVFSRQHWSTGFALGAGVGQGKVDYTRTLNGVFVERRTRDQVVPTFEGLVYVDLRPARVFSIAPYFGMRDGFLTGGAALRIHFVR